MDQEFHLHLIEIKPYLLNLSHKAERQLCAQWIKKLCEQSSSLPEKENRNAYAKLLLHMLKHKSLHDPFNEMPEPGQLKKLPSYVNLFFDDPLASTVTNQLRFNVSTNSNESKKAYNAPDWVENELSDSCNVSHTYHDNSNLGCDKNTVSEINLPKDNFLSRSGRGYREEQNLLLLHDREFQIKSKLLEAEFHEEKLTLQHKHDIALQKVLNRKNGEIDDLKRHFKEKEKDYDDIQQRLERKVQGLLKDLKIERESKEKQTQELTALLEETSEAARLEYEEKVHAMQGEMEKEKYELQKTHTKNIQDLLDDTNQRLESMEAEYNSQTMSTKVTVSELESHVTQLTSEVETAAKAKQILLGEKQALESENSQFKSALETIRTRYEAISRELSSVRGDLVAKQQELSERSQDNERLKEEQNKNSMRVHETMRELEEQLETLKQSLVESESRKSQDLQNKEDHHHKDVRRLQHLHEEYVSSLQMEWEQEKANHYRDMRKIQESLVDKEQQITKLTESQELCAFEAKQVIESYKLQTSDAQQKVYADMRKQLKKLEVDLESSKSARSELQSEFEKQIRAQNNQHSSQLSCVEQIHQLSIAAEREKEVLLQKYAADRDKLVAECEKRVAATELRLRSSLSDQEKVANDRKLQQQEIVVDLEEQVRSLREELLSSNQLRRQQLVELGLLREEERQKSSRDHEIAVAKFQADMERQLADVRRQHAHTLEEHALQMKLKIEMLEKGHQQQLDRAQERIRDAQDKEQDLRVSLEKRSKEFEGKFVDQIARLEEENKSLRSQNSSLNISTQANYEKLVEECRVKERRLQNVEFSFRNELSRVKLECEERIQGLIPKSIKVDLEETIDSLRSQVKSLQQRIEILQDDSSLIRSKSLSPSVRL